MQWRLFSQWDPIKFRWIISCSAPPLWTGIFILRKVWLGKLCWDAQGGSELGNQSEAKLDRPSDQWRVQGRIRVRAWKEAVCLLPSDNILNLISSPWFWLQPFYQQSQLRLAPLRNVTGPSLNESLSRMTLCNPMDYSVHGILQARILEWVAVPFSRRSSQSRDQTQVSHIAGIFFTSWATRVAHLWRWADSSGDKQPLSPPTSCSVLRSGPC